jgi:hypothetical protein
MSQMDGIFSHDGVKDALTHCASPPFFYQSLNREIALSERKGHIFSLIRIVLNMSSDYEVKIIEFSHVLRNLTRDEDLVARLGELEFTILLRGEEREAATFRKRIALHYENEIIRGISQVTVVPGEGALEILNRLDAEDLLSLS